MRRPWRILRAIVCGLWRFAQELCNERFVCRGFVILLHVVLVGDVAIHRSSMQHPQTAWAFTIWIVAIAALVLYFAASLADPGWPPVLDSSGSVRPSARCCLLGIFCAPVATLTAAWRTLMEMAGEDESIAPKELTAAAESGIDDEGEIPASVAAEAGGIQKRRGCAEEFDEESGTIPTQCGQELHRCTVCGWHQQLRMKHCKDCGRCVSTHDHHCPWLGNCVGENNRVLFFWYLFFQLAELGSFFYEGCQGISLDEPSVFLLSGLLIIAIFFLMVLCLLSFHSFLALSNLTTWEHMSWRRITYLKGYKEDHGSPFTRNVCSNLTAYCVGPHWCPTPLRRWAALRYSEDGSILWELGEQRQPCIVRICTDWCGC